MDKAQYHPAYFFPEKSGFETQILLCLSFFHVLCVSCHVNFSSHSFYLFMWLHTKNIQLKKCMQLNIWKSEHRQLKKEQNKIWF